LPNIPNLWAVLAILSLIVGTHGAAYIAGRTAVEASETKKENKALISWVTEQKSIADRMKPLYDKMELSNDNTRIRGVVAGSLDDLRLHSK
jgi:hypothetical protein